MQLAKYKFEEKEFLIYGGLIPEEIKEMILIDKDLDKSQLDANWDLPIYNYFDFVSMFIPNHPKRTRDKILEENGIIAWGHLELEYYNVRHKQSKLSKAVRDMVIEKYSEIINNV